jgi:hypothetical protein
MKVIPLSVLSILLPDEGYSTFSFEHTIYLMKVIPLSVLSILLPDEGYSTFGFEHTIT